MEEPDLQLRTARGPRVSCFERAVLAREIPRRWLARRCRRLDAVPGLRAQRRRVGAQYQWRQGESRRDNVSPSAQSVGLSGTSRRPGDRRGIDRVADGVAPGIPRRTRLRHEMEHGLDARYARLHAPGADLPEIPPRPSHVFALVRILRELRASFVARRGRARQGFADWKDARRSLATVRESARDVRLYVEPSREKAAVHGRRIRA